MKMVSCKNGLSIKEIEDNKCPSSCEFTCENGGACFAECLSCGGDLIETNNGLVCLTCGSNGSDQ